MASKTADHGPLARRADRLHSQAIRLQRQLTALSRRTRQWFDELGEVDTRIQCRSVHDGVLQAKTLGVIDQGIWQARMMQTHAADAIRAIASDAKKRG